MRFRHPFERLSASGLKRAFTLFLILSLVVMAGLQVTGAHLKTTAAPQGIVSFEFAGDLSAAHRMMVSWGQRGQLYAAVNLGLDYLFLTVYACAISLACVLAARSLSHRIEFLANLGILLAWVQFLAALLDCTENYGLIQVLVGTEKEVWPEVARWCAGPKFLIIALGFIYIIMCVVLVGISKSRQP
jgi:hypothetical protein